MIGLTTKILVIAFYTISCVLVYTAFRKKNQCKQQLLRYEEELRSLKNKPKPAEDPRVNLSHAPGSSEAPEPEIQPLVSTVKNNYRTFQNINCEASNGSKHL